MGAYRVMTGTVSFGERVTLRLGTVTAGEVATAERIAARMFPTVSGYRTPWVEEIAGATA